MQQIDLLLHRPILLVTICQLDIEMPEHLAQYEIHLCPREPTQAVSRVTIMLQV